MKLVISKLVLVSLNALAAPCGGAQGTFWTNPDGTHGGWVSKTAKVQSGVVVAPGAEVCGSAQVKNGAQVLDKAKVSGDALVEGRSKITGTSHVFARAEIRGSARVHSSIVCQASIVDGINVKDSDYYCQTEDPEPLHPGDEGKKTLLGIDSDGDGVRDDLEIWINDYFSNTPKRDLRVQRLEFKKFSKESNLMIQEKSRQKLVSLQTSKEQSLFCLHEILSVEETLSATKLHQAFLMNTPERFKAYTQAQRYLGDTDTLNAKKGRAACSFK